MLRTNGDLLAHVRNELRAEVLHAIDLLKATGMPRENGGHFLALTLGEIIAEIEVGMPDFRKQVAAAMDAVATHRPRLEGIITP